MGTVTLFSANKQWVKAGHLIIDLNSMEKGFLKMEKHRQEIWDYIQYRESLLKWPSSCETVIQRG